jgi:hypothetical protein
MKESELIELSRNIFLEILTSPLSKLKMKLDLENYTPKSVSESDIEDILECTLFDAVAALKFCDMPTYIEYKEHKRNEN